MPHDANGLGILVQILVLLAAAVITAPLARRFGLSAIVGYLAAGIAIGPWGLQVFHEPETVRNIAEFGVVLLLFVIGLELKLSRLFAMRRAIFGLGAAQLAVTAAVLGTLAMPTFGMRWQGATVAGIALAMSATAIALQILEERGDLQTDYGQRAFAVLLFQDIAVVPLLALLPLLAPFHADDSDFADGARAALIGALTIGALLLAGRHLLNPFFRLLANTGAREAMTAAALLVVLGAALGMRFAGMSMALGAFLAGLLLAESNFRHQLEADIEPFRGLLLALFFMSIGMSIDLGVVMQYLGLLIAGAIAVAALKAGIVGVLFGATCRDRSDALRAGAVLTPAGEFAFVLLPLGQSIGVLTAAQASLLAALAALTMLIGPPIAAISERLLSRYRSGEEEREPDDFSDARGSVIIVGFGRFGQIVSQAFLAQRVDVTTIDKDVEMIQSAGRFGFKVYYGDGTRLDVLRAAGAAKARLIAVCIDDRDAATRIVEIVKIEFPFAQIYARSYDRRHTLELLAKGVDYEMRETIESALAFGGEALRALGVSEEDALAAIEDIRNRDRERLALQQAGGMYAGLDVLHRPRVEPEPLTGPRREGRALNPEAADAIKREKKASA
ncbi:MAG TPA: monovalent cation:proton antiporter-2 (CPA2) family protein [Xanthobacteraceae bacterium]|jgi:monovalent cation:proton antiporter-2 (CPA2) family protein